MNARQLIEGEKRILGTFGFLFLSLFVTFFLAVFMIINDSYFFEILLGWHVVVFVVVIVFVVVVVVVVVVNDFVAIIQGFLG